MVENDHDKKNNTGAVTVGFPTAHLSKDFAHSSGPVAVSFGAETTVEQEHQKIQNALADYANLTGAVEFAARGSINVTGTKLEAEKKKKENAARLLNANLTKPELKAIDALNDKIKDIKENIKKDEVKKQKLEDKNERIQTIMDKAKAGTLDKDNVQEQKEAAKVGMVIKDRTNENVIAQGHKLKDVNQVKIDELDKGITDQRAIIADLKSDIKAIKENAANDNHEANKAIFEKHGLNANGVKAEQAIKHLTNTATGEGNKLDNLEDQMDTYEQVVHYTQKLKEHTADNTKVTVEEMSKYKDLLSEEAIKILETSEEAKAALNGNLNSDQENNGNNLEFSVPSNNVM